MPYFAKIENNMVVEVIVSDTDFVKTIDGEWIETCPETQNGVHLQNGTPLRQNFAGVGFHYDREHDVFYMPWMFPSWTINKDTWKWEAPVPQPETTETQVAVWNEDTLNWDLIDVRL